MESQRPGSQPVPSSAAATFFLVRRLFPVWMQLCTGQVVPLAHCRGSSLQGPDSLLADMKNPTMLVLASRDHRLSVYLTAL